MTAVAATPTAAMKAPDSAYGRVARKPPCPQPPTRNPRRHGLASCPMTIGVRIWARPAPRVR